MENSTPFKSPETSTSTRIRKTRLSTASLMPQLTSRGMTVRHSDRNVRAEIYHAYADLLGSGLSLGEASVALKTVAKIFGCNWKVPIKCKSKYDKDPADISNEEEEEDDGNIDLNQLPTHRTINTNVCRIYASSLKIAGE